MSDDTETDGNRHSARPICSGLDIIPWCSGKKIVITGGCGFLGLHVARLLYKEASDVHITLMDITTITDDIMRFITGTATCGRPVHHYHGSVLAISDLTKAFDKASLVIHCAAKSDLRMDRHINREVEAINVEGTANVVKVCQSAGVEALINIGSIFQVIRDSVSKQEGINETVSVIESDELVMDTFGHSKNKAERTVLDANANGTLYTCSVRCPPLYGENDTALIPSAAWVASKFMGYYPRIGKRSVKMSVMYVENAAYAVICAAKKLVNKRERNTVGGNFYYVTDDTEHVNYSDFFGHYLCHLDYDVRLGIRIPVKLVTFWLYLLLVVLVFLMIFFDFREMAGLILKYQRQAKILTISHSFSRDKAKRDLNYDPPISSDLAFKKSHNYYVRTCRYLK